MPRPVRFVVLSLLLALTAESAPGAPSGDAQARHVRGRIVEAVGVVPRRQNERTIDAAQRATRSRSTHDLAELGNRCGVPRRVAPVGVPELARTAAEELVHGAADCPREHRAFHEALVLLAERAPRHRRHEAVGPADAHLRERVVHVPHIERVATRLGSQTHAPCSALAPCEEDARVDQLLEGVVQHPRRAVLEPEVAELDRVPEPSVTRWT